MDPCLFNLRLIRLACIPAANGHFTARALARFYSALAEGGHYQPSASAAAPAASASAASAPAQPLLPKSAIEEMSRSSCVEHNPLTGAAVQWGCGLRVYGFHDATADGGVRYSGFGHAGLGGSIAFCDPHSRVAVRASGCCVLLWLVAE